MLKRNLLVLSLLMGAACAAPILPTENRYDAPITVQTGTGMDSLAVVLQALGRSVGLTVVTEGIPADKTINYNISEKPFREVWNLLVKLNDLDYELVGNDIVVVGPSAVVQKFRPPPVVEEPEVIEEPDEPEVVEVPEVPQITVEPEPEPEPDIREFYTILSDPDAVIKFLQAEAKDVVVTRFGNTSLIAITGTEAELAAVTELLETVDVAPPVVVPEPVVEVPVVVPPKPEPTIRRFYTTNMSPEDIVNFLKTEVPTVVINRVGQTRTLSITGTAAQQDEITKLLANVDIAPEQVAPVVRVQQIFRLSYAKADDVKSVLTQTFTAAKTTTTTGANGATSTTGSTDSAGTAGSTFTVVMNPNTPTAEETAATKDLNAQAPDLIADVRSNSLIVRGTPTQIDQIAEALKTLDQRVPQVNVQVRIQEVSRTAANSLGLNWSAPFGNFSTLKLGSSGIKSVFDAATNLVGFNLGASLDALESQGLTKRVDDSSLTLQSGQAEAANVKSGGTLIITIVGDGSQKSERTLDYGVNVGISNLQVANDGTINMKVNASVKGFASTPTNPLLINLTNNEASTVLSFKSGSTVLLGGLLSNSKTEETSGVPILSSIPIIGSLFKSTSITDKETQLMLVITANVVE